MPTGLYVHIPFCAHRCGYCAFVTTPELPDLHARYVAALAGELELRHAAGEAAAAGPFDTVFIGGGTPTLLARPALGSLLTWVAALAAPGAEITIECNPETVTPALAADLVAGGATRVSLGAQSLQPDVLDVLERRATPQQVRTAVAALRAAGVPQLNLDMVWGVPGQDVRDLDADLDALLQLAPDHLSAYELEYKPGTRLTRQWAGRMPPEEASDGMYEQVVDACAAAGLRWYETANFARPGAECRHNLGYWRAHDHVGVGIGAWGTTATGSGGVRRRTLPNLPRWLAAIEEGTAPPARVEMLDDHTVRSERIMLGLRVAGLLRVDAADIADGIVDVDGLAELERHGLVRTSTLPGGDRGLETTRRGRLLLNTVLVRLLDP